MPRNATIICFCLILGCSIFLRTYHYKNINIDYDEDATLHQLKSTSLQRLYNYVLLQNAFKYEEINQIEKGITWHINFCFPLSYIPLKIAFIFRQDIEFLRFIVIMFGAATPVFLFGLGEKYSLQTGIIASTLLLFHPWAQHHSTYIRLYGFWAFISILCLWYLEFTLTKIQQGRVTPVHVIFLAICIFLPCTVHAFGVVSSLFLLCMLLSHFYYQRPDIAKISSSNTLIFGITFVLSTIIVGTNWLVFAYAVIMKRSSYGIDDPSLEAQTPLHVIASTLFNFGYFYPIIILLIIIFMLQKRGAIPIPLKRYTFSVIISLIPTLLIMLKSPGSIRPDYMYGNLPYLLLLLALSIEYMVRESCSHKYAIIGSAVITVFLITSTLPTFVSNVFIDNDRLDYRATAQFISNIQDANFYSTAPGYFNQYLNTDRVHQIAKIDPETCQSAKDEYFLIRMRKGKSTQFFYDYSKLKNVQLIDIIGKDRIDLRANKVYLFFRSCAQDSIQTVGHDNGSE